MKRFVLSILSIYMCIILFAQYDSLWSKTYGGAANDYCNSIIETSDSYYLMGGVTYSYGAGESDFWLIKTDTLGDTLWTHTYGGSNWDDLNSIIETQDGCYLMTGYTYSYGAGAADVWLVKTDANGDTIWTKTYGGSGGDFGTVVLEMQDGSILIGGYTMSFGAGETDYYIIKTDSMGDTLWTKVYGQSGVDYIFDAKETHDGCYVFSGFSGTGGTETYDFAILKTDSMGDTLWLRTYGGLSSERCYSMAVDHEGYYLASGYTTSYGAGNSDAWLIKVDSEGDTLWTKTYGGSSSEKFESVMETSDSCYMLTGFTSSYGAGNFDVWLIKTDNTGDTLWTRTYGGTGHDEGYDVCETRSEKYIIGGYTDSYGSGNDDFYLIEMVKGMIHPFLVIPSNDRYFSDKATLSWYKPMSYFDMERYKINIEGNLDSVSAPDTIYESESMSEGIHEWYITAYNVFGYSAVSDTGEFYIDQTPPIAIFVEQLKDTNYYAGPYSFDILAEDSMAGMDSARVYYALPGDTSWHHSLASHAGGFLYRGEIPAVSTNGNIFYYVILYDKAEPSNYCRYPAYPDVYSFRITGLTGIEDNPSLNYSLKIKQIDNTSICLTLPKDSPVNIAVYDINGRAVINKAMNLPAGQNTINLDITPGVYFLKLNTPYGSAEQKIVNIK